MNKAVKSTRDGFGDGLIKLAARDKRVVVVSADLKSSLKLDQFANRFPERFFEVGVAEENMIGVAAGLALGGLLPFTCSFACFSPGLTFGQIRQSICQTGVKVVIVGSHGGVLTGADGSSHQMLEDLSLMTALPGMTVIVPADSREAEAAVLAVPEINGPVYLRLARPVTPILTLNSFKPGKAQLLKKGSDITLVGCGPLLVEALKAADDLAKEGIAAEVINCSTVKPLDKKAILTSAGKTRAVVTLEDHSVNGGLGSMVAAILAENLPVPLKMIGMTGFGSSAWNTDILLEKYGLNRQNIVKISLELLERK